MKTIVSALGPFASLYLFASAAAAHEPGSGHQQPHLDVGTDSNLTLNGRPLPNDFIYGCGVSAYQIEGAWNEDGKGVSIWDEFAHEKGKGHIKNDETGDVAMDFYHTYHQDIPLFVDSFGISAYDYTISWPRILPNGRGDKPNAKGVEFYHNVNEATHKAGATASCTLYHWDLVSLSGYHFESRRATDRLPLFVTSLLDRSPPRSKRSTADGSTKRFSMILKTTLASP